jgi:L-ascorbate 6-phosphate lactonase
VSNSAPGSDPATTTADPSRYHFTRNDPFDRNAPIIPVVATLQSSREYMASIRGFAVPSGAIALWFFGQNGFVVKDESGLLIGIDLYLTNSCATTFAHLPFRLDRQLPVFVEPEDLDIDVFLTTHSHDDHCDMETLRRLRHGERMRFVGPFDSCRRYREAGLPEEDCTLIHPGEHVELAHGLTLQASFSLPTDDTDLNHTGVLLIFPSGIRFYNSGDTAYAPRLGALLPRDVDVCTICINGGFHNLTPTHAAEIVAAIRPRIAIPCHYDMMVNNVGSPEMFRIALLQTGSEVDFHEMRYYEPWIYQRLEVHGEEI